MAVDGVLAATKPLRDLLIAQAFAYELQHVALARCEPIEAGPGGEARRRILVRQDPSRGRRRCCGSASGLPLRADVSKIRTAARASPSASDRRPARSRAPARLSWARAASNGMPARVKRSIASSKAVRAASQSASASARTPKLLAVIARIGSVASLVAIAPSSSAVAAAAARSDSAEAARTSKSSAHDPAGAVTRRTCRKYRSMSSRASNGRS